jgi:hypothetical protein
MKLANAIEGGLTGATTLTLLQEALHKLDSGAPRPLLHRSGILKELRKSGTGKKKKDSKLYIRLAGELLSNAAYFGLTGLGKKKNAVLRGGLLGAAAGLGSVFLTDNHEDDGPDLPGQKESMKKKLLTVSLYTAGGLLAGLAVKKLNKKGKKRK